jgi:hypothetical protein
MVVRGGVYEKDGLRPCRAPLMVWFGIDGAPVLPSIEGMGLSLYTKPLSLPARSRITDVYETGVPGEVDGGTSVASEVGVLLYKFSSC